MASKSAQQEPEKAEVIEEALESIETTIERVKALYEQYFLGIQKQPPSFIHTEVERKLRDLAQIQIRNTAQRYRFVTLQQKFGAYHAYWRRTLRQIENGTYARSLSKVGRKAAMTGEEIPEEILAAMPKRMREQVRRDREAVLARLRRQNKGQVDDAELLTLAPEAAHADVPDTVKQPQVLDPRGAYFLDEDDSVDLEALFAEADDEITNSGPPPRPPPVTPPAQPTAPAQVRAAGLGINIRSPSPVAQPQRAGQPAGQAGQPVGQPGQPVRPNLGQPGPGQPLRPNTATPVAGQPIRPPVGQPAPRPNPGLPGQPGQPVRPNPGMTTPVAGQPIRPPVGQPAPRPNLGQTPPGPSGLAGPPPIGQPAPRPNPGQTPSGPSGLAGPPPSGQPAPRPNPGQIPPGGPPPGQPAIPPVPPRPGQRLAPPMPAPGARTPPMAPSQVTRPNPIAAGASTTRPVVPVETMAGPFPRAPAPAPVAKPAAPPARVAATRTTPTADGTPMRPPPGMTDADVNALYAKYVKAKEMVGETAGPGAYGKLLKTINAQAPKIMEQYNAKAVDFSVVVKDNQVVIRAKPKT